MSQVHDLRRSTMNRDRSTGARIARELDSDSHHTTQPNSFDANIQQPGSAFSPWSGSSRESVHRSSQLLRAGDVLALQRTVGNRRTQQALFPQGHRPADRVAGSPLAGSAHAGLVIQRKEMDAQEIMSALRGISVVKKKLDQKLQLGGKKQQDAALYKMRTHTEQVLQQYEGHFKGQEGQASVRQAVMIATVLESVARVIALNELNDPALAPDVAVKLFEVFDKKIRQKLKKMDQGGEAIDLARVLVSDDPLQLYMHNELNLGQAARQIRSMAFAAGMSHTAMFELLRQRFEIEMATLTRQGVKSREANRGTYSVAEATGEISEKYFNSLFGDAVQQPKWTTDDHDRTSLEFTNKASQRLGALEQEVSRPTLHGAGKQSGSQLTWKQDQHLDAIKQREMMLMMPTIDGRAAATIAQMLGVELSQARSIVQDVKDYLRRIPITLTVQGMNWFGQGIPSPAVQGRGGTKFLPGSARAQETSFAKLFGAKKVDGKQVEGSAKHLGKWVKPEGTHQDRGENYNRFRAYKDQLMTGSNDFSDKDLPVFAAVNINWPAYSSQSVNGQNYAVNAYGDTHFVLDRASIADRCVFTATDHGQPRHDIYLAFCDFLFATEGITGLQDMQYFSALGPKIAKHVINAATLGQPVATGTQPLAVQIFGGLDISTDVKKIYAAPSIDDTAKANIRQFCQTHGIPVKFLAQPEEAVMAENWFVPSSQSRQQGNNFESEIQDLMRFQDAANELGAIDLGEEAS